MEQIYTIPVNEAFDKGLSDSEFLCPFCRLYADLNKNEAELILGASVMSPETRKQTNAKGFCKNHFSMLLAEGEKLPLDLLLESHLDEINKMIIKPLVSSTVAGKETVRRLKKLSNKCYICEKVDSYMEKMQENAAMMWVTDETFRTKCSLQPFFCIEHFTAFVDAADKVMDKKSFSEFYREMSEKEKKVLAEIKEDVSFFASKFDYRNDSEPWNGREKAPEKAVSFISGENKL